MLKALDINQTNIVLEYLDIPFPEARFGATLSFDLPVQPSVTPFVPPSAGQAGQAEQAVQTGRQASLKSIVHAYVRTEIPGLPEGVCWINDFAAHVVKLVRFDLKIRSPSGEQ